MSTLPVRVRVHDAWEEVALEFDPNTPIAEVKREALRRTRRPGDPSAWELKFRGASVLDERESLAEAGVVRNAQLIVLLRRRQAVR